MLQNGIGEGNHRVRVLRLGQIVNLKAPPHEIGVQRFERREVFHGAAGKVKLRQRQILQRCYVRHQVPAQINHRKGRQLRQQADVCKLPAQGTEDGQVLQLRQGGGQVFQAVNAQLDQPGHVGDEIRVLHAAVDAHTLHPGHIRKRRQIVRGPVQHPQRTQLRQLRKRRDIGKGLIVQIQLLKVDEILQHVYIMDALLVGCVLIRIRVQVPQQRGVARGHVALGNAQRFAYLSLQHGVVEGQNHGFVKRGRQHFEILVGQLRIDGRERRVILRRVAAYPEGLQVRQILDRAEIADLVDVEHQVVERFNGSKRGDIGDPVVPDGQGFQRKL